MKKLNFFVDSNHALDVDGHHIDLHNNFDLKNIEYSIKQNTLSLTWIKAIGDWVLTDEFEDVQIVFESVSFLNVQTRASDKFADRQTLSFLGYLHPQDTELMDGCLDESEATSEYHMIFAFEDGLAVKIFSDTVICLLGK